MVTPTQATVEVSILRIRPCYLSLCFRLTCSAGAWLGFDGDVPAKNIYLDDDDIYLDDDDDDDDDDDVYLDDDDDDVA